MQKEIEDFLNEISGFNPNTYLQNNVSNYELLDIIIDAFKEVKKQNPDWNVNTLFGYIDYYNLPYNRAEVIIKLAQKKELKNFNKLFGLPRKN